MNVTARDAGGTMKTETIELDFPESVVFFPVTAADGQKPVWEIVEELIPICDTLTGKGVEIAASFNQHVSCAKGCGVCCCQMVPLSPPEALIIADVVDHLPPDRKKTVLAAFDAARAKIEAAGMLEAIASVYAVKTDPQRVLAVNKHYFELAIPCPFLVDGSCSIYARRPSRCREYSVLTPAALCADPFDTRIRRLPLTIRLCESFSHAWASLAKEPPVIVPLITALQWAAQHPEASMLSVDNSVKVARAVLEFACEKANQRARERMK